MVANQKKILIINISHPFAEAAMVKAVYKWLYKLNWKRERTNQIAD